MESRQQIIAWLGDAHGMEQALEKVLRQQIRDCGDFPAVRARLEQHETETRRHAEQVVTCLQQLGATPSGLKSMAGGLIGMVQGASTSMFRDEILKSVIANYAMEHFEIACYRSLRCAANEAGLPEIAEVCERILSEETAMAEWLEEQIPDLTRAHLHSLAAS